MSTQSFHGTTVLAVRKEGRVAMGADGQVTMGDTIVKTAARKVRTLKDGRFLAGFAGAVADAFTLFEALEAKLEQFPSNLTRACVEMARTGGIARCAVWMPSWWWPTPNTSS